MDLWGQKMANFHTNVWNELKSSRISKSCLEMRKKVKKSPTLPKGSRRGHPIAWFALPKLKSASGAPAWPLGCCWGFFYFFLIYKQLFDNREPLTHFKRFYKNLPLFDPTNPCFFHLRGLISQKRKKSLPILLYDVSYKILQLLTILELKNFMYKVLWQ